MSKHLPPDLVLLLRGAADHPQDLLGGRTPLQYAELPNLRALSRRGRLRPFDAAPSGHSVHAGGDLFGAFGLHPPSDQDPPAGLIDWYGDGRDPAEGRYLHADPAHLAVTPEAAVVTDPDDLALHPEEAEELAEALNRELFEPEGARLVVLAPGCWLLHLPRDPGVRSVALESWIGADARGGLPRGAEEAAWHRLANEVQMLLAAHAVNGRRRMEGRPEVNTLWFWGAGAFPGRPETPPWRAVWGEAPHLSGLGRLTGTGLRGPVSDFQEVLREKGSAGGPVLAVADRPRAAGARGDLGAKVDALEALDQQWLGPLSTALAEGVARSAWVILGPEAPTGARPAEPSPPAPALDCRAGRLWPWNRPRPVSEEKLAGQIVGWEAFFR
ncbi:hypothetical protein [Thiohalorhabdus methylotrophus]|uniref:Phosphoglycerate mutase n=1 Tax=Thiohalorhabdus methylotrophus TaxID=3242694 RepID=A0ABV4TWC6_9GAMM